MRLTLCLLMLCAFCGCSQGKRGTAVIGVATQIGVVDSVKLDTTKFTPLGFEIIGRDSIVFWVESKHDTVVISFCEPRPPYRSTRKDTLYLRGKP